MIIRRQTLQAVLPATTSDDTRYNLTSIQVDPVKHSAVATDGHILLIATEHGALPDEDFPSVPGAEFHGDPSAPVVIPADVIRSLIATMPKRSTLPILQALQVGQNGSENTITVVATDLQAPRVATVDQSTVGEFPQYERSMPKADRRSVRVYLAVDVLEALIKSAKALGTTGKNGKIPNLCLDVPIGRKDRATVTTKNAEGEIVDGEPGEVIAPVAVTITGSEVTVTGCAMPCRF